MTKKRRTRKDKETAVTRRDALTFDTSLTEILATKPQIEIPKSKTVTPHKNHSYVIKDVRNTLLVVSILSAINIAIYIILKLSIVRFPGIEF